MAWVHLPILSEHILTKNRYCLSQALPLKRFQILCHCLVRVREALAMILCRRHHSARCEVQEMKDEFVRGLHFNSKRSDGVRRKSPQSLATIHISMAPNT